MYSFKEQKRRTFKWYVYIFFMLVGVVFMIHVESWIFAVIFNIHSYWKLVIIYSVFVVVMSVGFLCLEQKRKKRRQQPDNLTPLTDEQIEEIHRTSEYNLVEGVDYVIEEFLTGKKQ